MPATETDRTETLEALTILTARLVSFLAGHASYNCSRIESEEVHYISDQMTALIATLQESDR